SFCSFCYFFFFFFFSSRRRHTRFSRDWTSDVCSSDLYEQPLDLLGRYSYELLRACRLVADTGLHAKDWTRARAIRFLVEECGLRSEERRVGKECRSRGWRGSGKRKRAKKTRETAMTRS